MNDLSWLSELVNKLPATEPVPVTLFDTLGVATRETVISNVLAYYLNENEAHGLGRVFLDNLLSSMNLLAEDFSSPYTVERERHNIDILIQGEGDTWAVILENKIYHSLINPLDEYWKRVDCSSKRGVVVTLWPTWVQHKDYVNVTHKEWLDCVRRSVVPNVAWPDDARQRFLYTDFMTNMDTITNSLTSVPAMNEAIILFQQEQVNIDKLLSKQRELEKYVQNHLKAAFAKYGFVERGKYLYHPDASMPENDPAPPLRFFVVDEILKCNKLRIYFELHGKAADLGEKLSGELKNLGDIPGLKPDNASALGVYYHLACATETDLMQPNADLRNTLEEVIGRFFAEPASLYTYCRQFTTKS